MFGTQTIRYASNTKGKWPQWMVLGDGSVCLDVLCSFPQGTYRLWWWWWWCGCEREEEVGDTQLHCTPRGWGPLWSVLPPSAPTPSPSFLFPLESTLAKWIERRSEETNFTVFFGKKNDTKLRFSCGGKYGTFLFLWENSPALTRIYNAGLIIWMKREKE